MPFSAFRIIPFLLLFTLAACDSSDLDTFDIERYTGDPYEGTIALETVFPTSETITVEYGASLTVTDLGSGRARLVIDVDSPDADPVILEGTYSENGAELTIGEGEVSADLRLSASGNVSGEGQFQFFDSILTLDASGTATASRIDVVLNLEHLTGNEDVPIGTTITARINLTR